VEVRKIKSNIKRFSIAVLSRWRKRQRIHSKKFNLAGYTVYLNQFEEIQASISYGIYEPTETKWLYEILKSGMTFIDVGANIGYYSLLASSLVGSSGKVYSFDPSPYAYERLCQTIKLNNITNIHAYNLGLSDHPENVELALREIQVHSPSFCTDNLKTKLGISKLITLDSFAEENDIKFIDMIKIDVEGYEPNVIKGMTKLLNENKVNRIMIEINGYWLVRNNSSPEKLMTLISSLGFVLEKSCIYPDFANYLYVNASNYENYTIIHDKCLQNRNGRVVKDS